MLHEILTSEIDRTTKILWCQLFPFQHLLDLPLLEELQQLSRSEQLLRLRAERKALKAWKGRLR